MLVGVLAWPALATLRNENRAATGAFEPGRGYSASDRLRMDLLIGAARPYPAPVEIGQPTGADVLRYGLIPRALDSGRRQISTGRLINQMMGGSPLSSNTFMLIGNVWLLSGPLGLFIYTALTAGVLSIVLMRRTGPYRSALLVLGIHYLAWMGITFPDNLIDLVQSLITVGIAALLVRIVGRSVKVRPHKRDYPRPPLGKSVVGMHALETNARI